VTRFQATFERLRQEGAAGLFPYLTAGFPDVDTNRRLAEAAIEAGADEFEIGVPFSDPLADGATMQRASTVALERGATLDTALELTRFIRQAAPSVSIALMSYYNPLLRRGEDGVAAALAEAGADGVIVPDLPAEEAAGLDAALRAHELDLIPLLAPTSPDERIKRIGAAARGFIYCVALVGVTGARGTVSTSLGDLLGRIRAAATAPLVVGFGISRPEHVREVAALGADGVIVASALADLVERSADPVTAARAYLREMKDATLPSGVA
jgi:tryptophan synthase alpha chain